MQQKAQFLAGQSQEYMQRAKMILQTVSDAHGSHPAYLISAVCLDLRSSGQKQTNENKKQLDWEETSLALCSSSVDAAKVPFGRRQEFSVRAFWFRRAVRPRMQRSLWWWEQKPWSSWRSVAESSSSCASTRTSSERKTRSSLCLCVRGCPQSAGCLLRFVCVRVFIHDCVYIFG